MKFQQSETLQELNPQKYGLDLSEKISFENLFKSEKIEGTVQEAIEILTKIYSGTIGVEFAHLEVCFSFKVLTEFIFIF